MTCAGPRGRREGEGHTAPGQDTGLRMLFPLRLPDPCPPTIPSPRTTSISQTATPEFCTPTCELQLMTHDRGGVALGGGSVTSQRPTREPRRVGMEMNAQSEPHYVTLSSAGETAPARTSNLLLLIRIMVF